MNVVGEGLPELWSTVTGLLAAAGLWGIGGALLGMLVALLAAPLAARWTRGGWVAGCAWAVLLAVGLGAAGLYGGAAYGVARRSERLVQQEWLLERLAATTLLVVAEERGLDADGTVPISPAISAARERLDARMTTGALSGAALLGLGVPRLVTSVLDALEGIDRLTAEDLHGLRLGGPDGTDGRETEPRLSPPARELLASTAPIRDSAAAAIWAGASPHLLVATVFAAACLGLIVVVGTISRLLASPADDGAA